MRRYKFRLLKLIQFVLLVCTSLFLCSIYAHKIEPFWFEVKQIDITLPQLDRAFAGYRIVQISDLHAGDIINRKHLNSVIDAVNEQKPDLVVITGDHVSRLPRRYVDLLDIYARLHARDGTLAILGNHDVYNDADPIRTALKMNGVKLLENDVYTLERERATLHIAGVGDVFAKEDKLDRVLAQLPPTGAAIMLAHEPDFADEVAATKRFGLQLSGHSHGGQIRLPFFDGYVPELAQKYPLGRYQVGDMIQYTNRGIGSVKIYARFNCRPEISVFTLS
jgi:uncharacterized protein